MKILNKYFKISDPILTMLLGSGKNVILTCFFKHDKICVYAKFEVCLTPATGFLASDDAFLTNIKKKYFSLKFCRVIYQSKLKFKNLEQNWMKTGHLLFQIFESLISMDSCIVHWLPTLPPATPGLLWRHNTVSRKDIVTRLLSRVVLQRFWWFDVAPRTRTTITLMSTSIRSC